MSEAKWIEFIDQGLSVSGKTRVWKVQPIGSKDGVDSLGLVKWYGPWRKYCFYPQNGTAGMYTVFEWDCLRDIASFLEEKTREHREVSHG